eukprot:279325-Rhodomonas_salina.1
MLGMGSWGDGRVSGKDCTSLLQFGKWLQSYWCSQFTTQAAETQTSKNTTMRTIRGARCEQEPFRHQRKREKNICGRS